MATNKSALCGEITLVHDCMICRREVILMAKRDYVKLPEKGTTLPQVCEECREKYLKEGILLINPDTGRLVVLKEEAFKRIFKGETCEQTIRKRIAWTDDKVLDMLQNTTG